MTQYILTQIEASAGVWFESILPALYAGRVVAADQRGPRLEHPFATFKVISDLGVAATATSFLTATPGTAPDTFVNEICEVRSGVLSVNVYGPTAYADLSRALLIFQGNAANGDFSVQGSSGIRRIPGTTLQAREDRAQVDFTFMYVATAQEDSMALEETTGTFTPNP